MMNWATGLIKTQWLWILLELQQTTMLSRMHLQTHLFHLNKARWKCKSWSLKKIKEFNWLNRIVRVTIACFKACNFSSKAFKISSINLNQSSKFLKTITIWVIKDLKALGCILSIRVWFKLFLNHLVLLVGKLLDPGRQADLNLSRLTSRVKEAVLEKSQRTNGAAYETILRDHSQTQEIFRLIFRCQSTTKSTLQRHKSRHKSLRNRQETRV